MSTTFCDNKNKHESSPATTPNAVDSRCPFDCHVGNGLLGRGNKVKQPLGLAALDVLDQDAAIFETHDAEFADQVRRHRATNIIIEDEPAVEERTQAIAPDFDRD